MSTFISEPGTKLGGRYRLEDRIAAASGWAAWKAIDEILARAVTVLTFAPGFPRISAAMTAARAASRLTDSRLSQVFDVEDDWDNAYVVMEWVVGDTLDDLLATGPLEPARAARIVAEAAAALSVAHAAGLAHLCLTPASLRMTQGGGVKVVGLGLDAALSGATAPDPAMADTAGLGQLLYAALTGLWPGPDYPSLPSAPIADGSLRRPRQVRAGVPAALDDITCQALQLGSRGTESALRRPADLATALKAVIPPLPPPPASPAGRPDGSRRGQQHAPARAYEHEYWPEGQRAQPRGTQPRAARPFPDSGAAAKRRSWLMPVVIVALALAAVAGVVVLIASLLTGHTAGNSAAHGGRQAGSGRAKGHQGPVGTGGAAAVLPVSAAAGYDPLALSDTGNEMTSLAGLAIDNSASTDWMTQQYATASYGNLKAGSGLLLDMGAKIRLNSITVQFGTPPGASAQIMIGNSGERSAAAFNSLTTVARASGVSGTHTFTPAQAATGRYVVIWFTQLPYDPAVTGKYKYMAQVFNVTVRGARA